MREGSEPNRVEIGLIGDSAQDPLLFARIRSLFSAQAVVVSREAALFDAKSVLQPERADTVYLWIRVSPQGTARVYLALRQGGGSARYLFREVRLESGLDEVGSETLAQVTHSSAQALWLREQQTPQHEVVAALQEEAEVDRASGGSSVSGAVGTSSLGSSSVSIRPVSLRPTEAKDAPRFRFGASAGYTGHASGAEGWFHEPGGSLNFEYRGQLSLRLAARYLVPTEFDVMPARVRLTGASGEVRLGWVMGISLFRVRLEAGLGLLIASCRSSLIEGQESQAESSTPQNFDRGYAVAAGSLELPLGATWLALGADLRAPFRKTSYEIGGQEGAVLSSMMSPGATLEFGLWFDRL
ncbi:MAG TPA: hypothetical protein VFQ61_29855 [Polyangiaceae bacterium]|nr:hypothetical protein [Polyangiaceae bacterium]